MAKKRHEVQIDDDRWTLLWKIARKRDKPTHPTDIIRELIDQLTVKKTPDKKQDKSGKI